MMMKIADLKTVMRMILDNNGLIDYEKLNRLINLKRRSINDNLFREYFKIQTICLKTCTAQETWKEMIFK